MRIAWMEKSELREPKYINIANGIEECCRSFATIGKCQIKCMEREGVCSEEVVSKLKSASSAHFDGAASVQKAGRVAAGAFLSGCLNVGRDAMHEVSAIFVKAVELCPDAQMVRWHLIKKKLSLAKGLMYSDRLKNCGLRRRSTICRDTEVWQAVLCCIH